jgi:hypothetical protein
MDMAFRKNCTGFNIFNAAYILAGMSKRNTASRQTLDHMRTFFCILLLSFIFTKNVFSQDGQELKAFKVDLGLGTSVQSLELKGIVLYIEPSYTFSSRFKTGIRFEEAALNMDNIGSGAVTLDYYYFRNESLRLFAGGGFSHYNISHSGGCGDPAMYPMQITSTKNSGAIARIGFEAAHFRFGIEYNFVPSTYLISTLADGQNLSTVQYRNNYFALKIGMCIGGGKKKPKYGAP